MKKFFSTYKRVVGNYWKWAPVLAFISFLAAALETLSYSTLIPIFSALSVDQSIAKKNVIISYWYQFLTHLSLNSEKQFLYSIVAFFVLTISSIFLSSFGTILNLHLRYRIGEFLRKKYIRSLMDLDFFHFNKFHQGDASRAIFHDAEQVSLGNSELILILVAFFQTICFAAYLFLLSPKLSLITLFILTPYIVVNRRIRQAIKVTSRLSIAAVNETFQHISSLTQGIKYVKASGMKNQFVSRFNDLFSKTRKMGFKATSLVQFDNFILRSFAILAFVLLFAISTFILKESTSTTFIFMIVLRRCIPLISNIQRTLGQTTVSLPIFDVWADEMENIEGLPRVTQGTKPADFKSEILFNQVCFQYGPDRQTLENIDLTIQKGEIVAIVGESGAGKSTILDLLSGLLVPNTGTITVDGVNLREVDMEKWQKQIGLLIQNGIIVPQSVLENISLSSDTIDKERAIKAAKMAHAAEFIGKLPEGWNTSLGKYNNALSVGQLQRLQLARAFYRNSSIIILDEPTSALDAQSENLLKSAFKDLRGTKTTILVTHSISFTEIADRIYVIKEGKIQQQGSFEELLRNKEGIFYSLAKSQKIAYHAA